MPLRAVWITCLRYNFSAVVVVAVAVVAVAVAVFAVIYRQTMASGQLSLLKSYPNWP